MKNPPSLKLLRDRLIKFLCLSALIIGSASIAMNGLPAIAPMGDGRDVNNNNNNQNIDPSGWALCQAASEGRVELVQKLLDAGIPVDAKGEFGCTALTRAIWTGKEDVTALLIAEGANLHALNEQKQTPLESALRMPKKDFRIEICKQIIDAILEQSYNKKVALTLLGIKKFRNGKYLSQIDKHVIQSIAHQVYNRAEITKIVAQLSPLARRTREQWQFVDRWELMARQELLLHLANKMKCKNNP